MGLSESLLLGKSKFSSIRGFVNNYFVEKDNDFLEHSGKYHFEKVHPSTRISGLGFNLMKVEPKTDSSMLHKKVIGFQYFFKENLIKILNENIENDKDKEKVKNLLEILETPIYGEFYYGKLISNLEEFKENFYKVKV